MKTASKPIFFSKFVLHKSLPTGRKPVLSSVKMCFCRQRTITASSDYETGAFDYLTKSFSYITGACGYSFV